jgi:crooked neck
MLIEQAFEDGIRKNRAVISNWLKYAAWEESQQDLQRYGIMQ